MRFLPLCVPTVNARVTPELSRALSTHENASVTALVSVFCNPREAKERGLLRHISLTLIMESNEEAKILLFKTQRVACSETEFGFLVSGNLEQFIDLIIELTQYDETRPIGACLYASLVSFGLQPFMQKLECRNKDKFFTAHWRY